MRVIWILRRVILFVLCASVACERSECRDEECRAKFSCREARSCDCSSLGVRYEVRCNSNESLILSKINPGDLLRIECGANSSYSDYNLLEGLVVGPVESVDLELCPLPEVSLSNFLISLGTSSVKNFRFQSHRNLATFDKRHLAGFGNLVKLQLSSNNFTYLSEYFLSEVPLVTWLDLRDNNLEYLDEKFFHPVPDLRVLELGENRLQALGTSLFSNLKKLRLLNLWKNALTNVTRKSFTHLIDLQQLDLSSNLMSFLPNDLFRDLIALVRINLSSNNYATLPEGIFSENKNLETIRVHDNRRPLIIESGALANLTKLKHVHLMRNKIASIPENIFWESTAIKTLNLGNNNLSSVAELLFRDQKNLESLDLSENCIENLPDGVFRSLSALQTLNLSYNKIKKISRELFYGVHGLVTLKMEHNQLSFIDGESLTYLIKMKTAHFSHNLLSFSSEDATLLEYFPYADEFGRKSPFRNCLSLEELDLSNNLISDMFSDWQISLIKLRNLNLRSNKIKSLSSADVHFLSYKILIDLRENEISNINLENMDLLLLNDNSNSEDDSLNNIRILLDDNPLNCNCHAYEFFLYLERKFDAGIYRLVSLVPGNLKCKYPAELSGLRVEEVNSSKLTCTLNEEYECPRGCNCIFRRDDLGLIVNCTHSELTEIPGTLPIVAGTNHTELLLDGNRISRLPNSSYPGYHMVTHLHLSYNNISQIESGMFSSMLQVLTLDYNNLKVLSDSFVRFMTDSRNIRVLTLHNNPWKCDCSSRELLNLIQQKFKEIPHLSNVTCSGGNQPLSKMGVSDLCTASAVMIASCSAAAVLGVLVGTLAALYYRYQREVKVWLYSHRFCLWLVTEEELDREKLYDAFVSYSHKDENFVVNTLVPELESGENPFKLCLHYRDWIAGDWIPNQIARSVENSRRTLVVLSPNFLESVWSRMEFRAAHKQALSEGRARVIVLLYGDVGPTEDLDPELRAYISMNTYVKWGDPWFWGKLKYALPHDPNLVNSNLSFMRKKSMKRKIHLDDKLELIHTLDSSNLPKGGTTPPINDSTNGNEVLSKKPNVNN